MKGIQGIFLSLSSPASLFNKRRAQAPLCSLWLIKPLFQIKANIGKNIVEFVEGGFVSGGSVSGGGGEDLLEIENGVGNGFD